MAKKKKQAKASKQVPKRECVYQEIDDLVKVYPNISDDTKAILRALTVIAVELDEVSRGIDLVRKAVRKEPE